MIYFTVAIVLILIYMKLETTFLFKSVINFSTSPKGLKMVHLSDVHINKFYVSTARLLNYIEDAEPDIVVMSGDYIETPKNIPRFISFLELLSENNNVFITLGNHDHKALDYSLKKEAAFIQEMEAAGATVLLNTNTKIYKDGQAYNLIGIDDLIKGRPDVEKAFDGIKASIDSGCINIAVSHNPDLVFQLPKDKTDYFFCGHFHGGQIWMPFNLEFRLMRSEKLCKMKCFRGLHKINGINLYINRGLGNVIFPFRFFSAPEMAIVQFPTTPGRTASHTDNL